jgi:hypothetical protein
MSLGITSTVGNTNLNGLSGSLTLTGVVSELSVPGRYNVVLIDKCAMKAFRRTWSAVDGSYTFTKLASRPGLWAVLLFDHGASPKNIKGSDNLTLT